MTLFSILKIIISFVPLLIVLYLTFIKFKSTHYRLLNLETNEFIEVITDKQMAFNHLMNNKSVILDNHNLCKNVSKKMSKKGHLVHIYFDNVNGINLLILTRGANMFTKYAVRMEDCELRDI